MGSEAMEDCVQGALSSLYPPFESTAPPLLSQVFSVLESTYQHDSLRYLLDYFVPAKHLLHKLQQHACSQYLGCLFLHSGWPLCLAEKVVVQLSTLDWRILRGNDFYLQVVPFSTRCPRLALKCLAPGGRTVQEILVPESQHPLVFTTEWLHSVNKERGHTREVGGGLDTCLVSTCDGVVRLPWKEVVYPKFIHDPSEESGLAPAHRGPPTPSRLPSEGGSSPGGGWGGSSSGELDSWSWDDDEESEGPRRLPAPPNRRRRSEDGPPRPADGDYVELLEPRLEPRPEARLGPDGGADTQQRYLEMHAVCESRTLPLCRRGGAIKLRKAKAWVPPAAKRSPATSNDDVSLPPRARVAPAASSSSAAAVASPPRGGQCCSGSSEEKTPRSSEDSEGLYFHSRSKERRPGVGKERDGGALVPRSRESGSGDGPGAGDLDPGSHSDSVFEDADRPPSAESDATTPTSPDTPSRGWSGDGGGTDGAGTDITEGASEGAAEGRIREKSQERVCPRGREVKSAGFRPPRFGRFTLPNSS